MVRGFLCRDLGYAYAYAYAYQKHNLMLLFFVYIFICRYNYYMDIQYNYNLHFIKFNMLYLTINPSPKMQLTGFLYEKS